MCSKCNNPKHTYQYKVGDKGKTRDGRPYEIIAVDVPNLYNEDALVGYVQDAADTGKFFVCTWGVNGSYSSMRHGNNPLDLLPPEEIVYLNIYRSPTNRDSMFGYVHSSEATAKELANEPGKGVELVAVAVPFTIPNTQE